VRECQSLDNNKLDTGINICVHFSISMYTREKYYIMSTSLEFFWTDN